MSMIDASGIDASGIDASGIDASVETKAELAAISVKNNLLPPLNNLIVENTSECVKFLMDKLYRFYSLTFALAKKKLAMHADKCMVQAQNERDKLIINCKMQLFLKHYYNMVEFFNADSLIESNTLSEWVYKRLSDINVNTDEIHSVAVQKTHDIIKRKANAHLSEIHLLFYNYNFMYYKYNNLVVLCKNYLTNKDIIIIDEVVNLSISCKFTTAILREFMWLGMTNINVMHYYA